MIISESEITLNFPDNNFFRFQDCEGYRAIQNNLKEMDVCWYEQATDTLYLIELKNWQNNNVDEETDPNISKLEITALKANISKARISNLVEKSKDSMAMFISILLEKPYATNIKNCSPFSITKNTKIKLLSIINWDDDDLTYISSVNSAYKSKFSPYARLFGISTYIVLTKTQATEKFNWIL